MQRHGNYFFHRQLTSNSYTVFCSKVPSNTTRFASYELITGNSTIKYVLSPFVFNSNALLPLQWIRGRVEKGLSQSRRKELRKEVAGRVLIAINGARNADPGFSLISEIIREDYLKLKEIAGNNLKQ